MHAVLALESYAECTGPFAPNATMQAAVEAALRRHYAHMLAQVSAQQPPFWTDVWGSARYPEVLLGAQGDARRCYHALRRPGLHDDRDDADGGGAEDEEDDFVLV